MNIKDIAPLNTKGQKHGHWTIYWANGNIAFKANFVYGRKIGYAEFHYKTYPTYVVKTFFIR